MTAPLDTILDRDQPVRDVKTHFAPQLELLRDVTNYGSNLIWAQRIIPGTNANEDFQRRVR